MNWTCPKCQSENEVATDDAFRPFPQQTCATCGLVVDAQVEEPVRTPPPKAPKPKTSSAMNPIERRKVRKKGSELGTAFLIVCTLFVALFAFAFSSQLTAGIVIACCGIGVMILAAIYHIGERLDLILEELQNGNEARETARIEAKTVNQRSTASEEPVSR